MSLWQFSEHLQCLSFDNYISERMSVNSNRALFLLYNDSDLQSGIKHVCSEVSSMWTYSVRIQSYAHLIGSIHIELSGTDF